MVKDKNYITIQGWMRNLGLSGNRLLAFAIIYGFSQDENSVFSGGASYIADWLGITKRAVFDILKDLVDMGLVEKIEKNVNNMVVYDYRATSQGVKKVHGGSEKSSLGGSKKSSPHNNNNNDNNINNNNNNIKKESIKEKKGFGEFGNVKLTDAEYDKLKEFYGDNIDIAISVLDNYLASKGKRYKSHYAVMKKNGWVDIKVKEITKTEMKESAKRW